MSQQYLRKKNGKKNESNKVLCCSFSESIASKVDARSTSKAIGGDKAPQFP